MTGLSEVIGSWKTIATSVPQIERLSFSLAPTTSKPSIIDEPETVVLTRGCSPMIVRESTVLPDPDSPTMPRVSLRARSKETWFTAVSSPPPVAKVVVRSVTTNSFSSLTA